jgi:hypothetical protein
MTKKMYKLLLLSLLSSCSYFIGKIDTPLVDERKFYKEQREQPTFCPLEKKLPFQLVGNSQNLQTAYAPLLKREGLDFLDHFALWSLIQFQVRPDQSSPTSRFQVLFHNGGQSSYFDFFSEGSVDQYPYLYGIEWVLRKFGKKTSLESYAQILDASSVPNLKIAKDLANFLAKNKEAIKTNPELAPYYYRGTEILKEEETTPKLNYARVISLYRKSQKAQKIIVNTSLTKFTTDGGSSGSCNYDFKLYDNSIFLIDKIIPIANLFGLSAHKSAFMASSSQKLDGMVSLHGLPIFKGESKIRSSAVCVLETEKKKIWTFSNQSRDPGQHLFHLIRYGLPRSQSIYEVDKLIRHSRHLFLSDPVRLIIESNRSRSSQIESLLKLNIPIYNAEKLGNIWAYTHIREQDRFIIDDRNPGAFKCE